MGRRLLLAAGMAAAVVACGASSGSRVIHVTYRSAFLNVYGNTQNVIGTCQEAFGHPLGPKPSIQLTVYNEADTIVGSTQIDEAHAKWTEEAVPGSDPICHGAAVLDVKVDEVKFYVVEVSGKGKTAPVSVDDLERDDWKLALGSDHV